MTDVKAKLNSQLIRSIVGINKFQLIEGQSRYSLQAMKRQFGNLIVERKSRGSSTSLAASFPYLLFVVLQA
jgi:hypothetical protein